MRTSARPRRHVVPSRLVAAGLAAAATLSCGEGTSPKSPALVASPTTVVIAEGTTSGALSLSEAAGRGAIAWRVSALPTWLAASPVDGTLDGSAQSVALHADLTGLAPGRHDGAIELTAGGATTRVPVTLNVSPDPVALLSPAVATLDDGVTTTTIALTNAGGGALSWSATTDAAWLGVGPTSGELAAGATAQLTATVDRGPLAVGLTSAQVVVKSNARTASSAAVVYVKVGVAPAAAVSPASLEFPLGTTGLALTLSNPGKGALTWSISSASGALSVSPSSGTLEQGASVPITVTADRAQTSPYDDVATSLTVTGTNSSQSPITVPVVLRVVGDRPSSRFAGQVADAEYDRALQQYAVAFRDPSRLLVEDARSGNATGAVVPLPLPPTCLAISRDGLFAAVGHDHALSYVDLQRDQVVQTYDVAVNVGDVVLPGDGYAYVVPAGSGDGAIHVVDLATGAETVQASVLAGSVARLHPSAGVTYVTNGAAPSRMDKFATASGLASLLGSSPTDRAVGGNLWTSLDGSRLFAASGNVFASSPDSAQDMRWLAAFPDLADGIRALVETHGGTSGRLFVVPDLASGGLAPAVRVYDAATLAFAGSGPLPRVVEQDAQGLYHSYAAEGEYLLADPDLGFVMAVVRAPASASLTNPWNVALVPSWSWVP